jgi:hypothetical protein
MKAVVQHLAVLVEHPEMHLEIADHAAAARARIAS